ncbi:hypothetical protein BVG79_00592 [Ketogulonicigenium robustum]|uniref:Uncharacterized protein n=1 Tax=Ketogulonicigenium robustum TaxID=92947 RepID=A0A1W6NXJ0_9RHOB|nr:hypothetical protein BVG79_00592 [Ketogulonicigenium robustum]
MGVVWWNAALGAHPPPDVAPSGGATQEDTGRGAIKFHCARKKTFVRRPEDWPNRGADVEEVAASQNGAGG